MLTQHIMKESAEQLAATVGERRTAALGGSYVNTSALSFSPDPVLIKLVEDWQRRIPLEMDDFKDTFPEEVSQDDGEMTSDEEESRNRVCWRVESDLSSLGGSMR
jgi:hypothetical protein